MKNSLKIEELLKTDKTIIFFGTGKFAERLYGLFRLLGIKIAYCTDNNKLVWNQSFSGIKIYNPEKLEEEHKYSTLIIVASTFYEDISRQLSEYGFEENRNFFNGETIMRDACLYIENSTGLKAIMDYIAGRKIILYGMDRIPDYLVQFFAYVGLDVQYGIKEDTGVLVKDFNGLAIKSPDALNKEDKDSFVLIFSDKYYEVINALREYDFFEYLNCYDGNRLYNKMIEGQGILNILLKAYSEMNKDCFFVQVGANDGIKHDPLREFILNNDWKGILVEPVKYIFEELKSNYKDKMGLIFENVAISNKDELRDFYYFNEESGNDLQGDYPEYGTFIFEQIKEWLAINNKSERYLVKEKVSCLTIDSLLKRNNVQKFDVLCIDVEGYDYEIVKSVNFDVYKPDIIIYEINHLTKEDRIESIQFLRMQGYKVIEIGIDAVAIK